MYGFEVLHHFYSAIMGIRLQFKGWCKLLITRVLKYIDFYHIAAENTSRLLSVELMY